jgi:hypothetical protein
MPSTIYVLTYKDTGSVVSYCMLEKQKLPDKPAVAALLDRLVGDNLVLSLAASGIGFKIPKADLVVDELQIDDPAKRDDFARAPYKYILDVADPTKLGDGSTKKLGTPLAVNSYVLDSTTTPPSFAVTLSNPLGPSVNGYVFVEGMPVVAAHATAPTQKISFPLAALTAAKLYAVIFVGQGIAPFCDFIKAV